MVKQISFSNLPDKKRWLLLILLSPGVYVITFPLMALICSMIWAFFSMMSLLAYTKDAEILGRMLLVFVELLSFVLIAGHTLLVLRYTLKHVPYRKLLFGSLFTLVIAPLVAFLPHLAGLFMDTGYLGPFGTFPITYFFAFCVVCGAAMAMWVTKREEKKHA